MSIEVFVRHCHHSNVSLHKERLIGFSREKCHRNLMETADFSKVRFTFLLDTFYPMESSHFVKREEKFPIVEFASGNEAGSFLFLLEYVLQHPFSDDTILYFLEDDYLHRPGWVEILLEGFSLPEADYVTLYDHRDKYALPEYAHLTTKLTHTASCHWRTTPSTTNTYAMRFKTLKNHYEVHRAFSLGYKITADHLKFLRLGEMGAVLLSSLPGWSTHVEQPLLSPIHDWEQYLASSHSFIE